MIGKALGICLAGDLLALVLVGLSFCWLEYNEVNEVQLSFAPGFCLLLFLIVLHSGLSTTGIVWQRGTDRRVSGAGFTRQ